MTTRVLVTGSRDFMNKDLMRRALKALLVQWDNLTPDDILIVHGNASGADTFADIVARELGYRTEAHPAIWGKYGRRAGPIRNQEMVDLGAELCLAFPVGKAFGTRDCMGRARRANIKVLNITEPEEAKHD